ncbi:sugar phosphate isomerase/epimerase [bacterium]|jgi:sugar phosphate isomerase/epimerase|nr:sugar phosphate isomerase/epimerase [Verrucomicrobiales bacterium]MDA7644327.1 sugar phosphate isomerase/epimerase [Verrucomicrobiales bacterium]MDB4507748.1 sugar phosphate isomerase/epimerase [bacterium]MDF1789035.1 TIM barrel protein [Verrucomicrobiales bacterium]
MSFTRRQFLSAGALAGLSLAQNEASRPSIFCAFVKFVQDLPDREMARELARLGYLGIEATIRRKGQVEPTEVEDGLPKLVEALQAEELEITIMASDVNRADDLVMEKTLRVAAALGVKRYRMAYYRYDLAKPLRTQLDNLRPQVRELAALNKELGMQALYQNHAGAAYVGASLWDLDALLDDIDPAQIAVGFDVRHATVEGGTTWKTSWHLVQPRLGAVYVKDFAWKDRKPSNVPLGEGQVDPRFFTLAKKRADVPFTIHVEYLGKAGTPENMAALGRDLGTAKRLLR